MIDTRRAAAVNYGTSRRQFGTSGGRAVTKNLLPALDLSAMDDPTMALLRRYQPWRRFAEVAFWAVVLGAQVVFNSTVTWIDLGRGVNGHAFWEPWAWEITSNLAVGLLIPCIVAFERRFPLRLATAPRNVGAHVLGSLLFCLAHVAVTQALRYVAYSLMGAPFPVPGWLLTLAYEYLKDVRSYVLILIALFSYRFVLLRLQGEARVLDAPESPQGDPPPAPASRPERFLVRKLRREFLIAAADIDWLQAQGNYIGLRVNGHDYLLRSTLSDFLGQLDPARFVRVHRSYAVNLDRIAEIEPVDSGDARLQMKDGSVVPCSRRYRDALGAAAG